MSEVLEDEDARRLHEAVGAREERIAVLVWLRSSKLAHEGLLTADELAVRVENGEHLSGETAR